MQHQRASWQGGLIGIRIPLPRARKWRGQCFRWQDEFGDAAAQFAQDSVTIYSGSSFSISTPTPDREFDGRSDMVFIRDRSTPQSPSNNVMLDGGSNTGFTGNSEVGNNHAALGVTAIDLSSPSWLLG